MKNGFKVMDSDMHLMEPPDLWQRYIDPEFRGRAPVGVTSEEVRDLRLVFPQDDFKSIRTDRGLRPRGQNYERNQVLYRDHAARGWTADVQLEAMSAEGLDVAILFPRRMGHGSVCIQHLGLWSRMDAQHIGVLGIRDPSS